MFLATAVIFYLSTSAGFVAKTPGPDGRHSYVAEQSQARTFASKAEAEAQRQSGEIISAVVTNTH